MLVGHDRQRHLIEADLDVVGGYPDIGAQSASSLRSHPETKAQSPAPVMAEADAPTAPSNTVPTGQFERRTRSRQPSSIFGVAFVGPALGPGLQIVQTERGDRNPDRHHRHQHPVHGELAISRAAQRSRR